MNLYDGVRIDRLIRFENDRMCRFAAPAGGFACGSRGSAVDPAVIAVVVAPAAPLRLTAEGPVASALPFEVAVACEAGPSVAGVAGRSVVAERDLDGDESRRMCVWNDSEVKCVRNEAGSGFVR